KQCYVLQTPDECLSRHHEMTFVSWIRQYMYSYEQRRHDYYRAVTVDPFWEINPLTVVSELLAELFFTPLTSLGHFLGNYLNAIHVSIHVIVFQSYPTLPNDSSLHIPLLLHTVNGVINSRLALNAEPILN
ncbi:unnamed protein product, partial [Medioppia subpectinata]